MENNGKKSEKGINKPINCPLIAHQDKIKQ